MFLGFFRRIFQGVLKVVLWINLMLSRRHHFNKNGITLPKGPVLYLSNHQMNLDAVRLRVVNNRRIVFVAHEEVYRNKFYRFVAHNLADTVCRSTSKNDISYLKELFRAKKHGLSIGIYPEGGIAYFNESLHIDISIAKLAKKLDIPILLCNVNGGSFVIPRWAKYKGHNKVVYSYRRLITLEELRDLSVDALYDLMMQCLTVNDYDWQRVNMSKVRRKEPCANLNRALCVCPHCHAVGKLSFTPSSIHCSDCDHTFSLDEYDFVVGAGDIDDLTKWDKLQQNILYEHLLTNKDETLLHCDNISFAATDNDKYFKKEDTRQGNITLHHDKVAINVDGQIIEYNISNMSHIYVEFKNTLQFNHNGRKIRITSDSFPAYIWVSYINALCKIPHEQKS